MEVWSAGPLQRLAKYHDDLAGALIQEKWQEARIALIGIDLACNEIREHLPQPMAGEIEFPFL